MSVPLSTRLATFAPVAGTTDLLIPWSPVPAATDLVVTRTRAGATITLAYGTDWTWSTSLPSGPRVVLAAASVAGDVLAVKGLKPVARAADLTIAQKAVTAALNGALDTLTVHMQEARRDIDEAAGKLAVLVAAQPLLTPQLIDATGAVTTIDGLGGPATITLKTATTALAISNRPATGRRAIEITILQDATGGRFLTLPAGAGWESPGALQPMIDTLPSAKTWAYLVVTPTGQEWRPGAMGIKAI